MVTIWVGLGLLVLAAAGFFVYRAAEEKKRKNRRAATRKKELDKFYTSPLQALEKVDIDPDEGETFYYAGFAEWEPRASGATPQAMARQPGMLYLSNQRLCFIAALAGEEKMPFGSWREFTVRPAEIELRFPEGNTAFIHSEDMYLGPIFTRLSKKQFAPLHS